MSIISALIGSIQSAGGFRITPIASAYAQPGYGNPSQNNGSYSSYGTAFAPGNSVTGVSGTPVTGHLIRRVYNGFWMNNNNGGGTQDHPERFNDTIQETINDPYIAFDQNSGRDNYCIEWQGYWIAPTSGNWNFVTYGDDVVWLWLGTGALTPTDANAVCKTGVNANSVTVVAGQWYPIRIRFQEWSGGESTNVWAGPINSTPEALYLHADRLRYDGSTNGYSVPTYSLAYGGGNTVNEGSSQSILVGGTYIPDGTYYWTIETNAGDFATTSGSFSITNNVGNFSVTPTADNLTEGLENYSVAIRSGSISGTILQTLDGLNIADTSLGPTYTWGSYDTSISEGSTLTVNVNTTNVADTTTLFWNIILVNNISSGDFSATSGYFTITTNTGSFTVSPTADGLAEGNEPFNIEIRSGSTDGTVVLTSDNITINSSTGVRAPIAYKITDQLTGYIKLYNNVYSDITVPEFQNTTDINILKGSYPQPQAGWQYRNSPSVEWYDIISVTDNGDYWTLNFDGNRSGGPYTTGQLNDNTNSQWALGTTWTLEYWSKAYSASTGATYTVMSQYSDTTTGNDFIDIYYANGNLVFGGNALASFAEPTPEVWTHVAIVSDSGNIKAYYNGNQVWSYYGLNNNLTNAVNDLYIGRRGTLTDQYFNGELTDIRITSTARYTAAFDPMTVSLAPARDGDTRLLLTPTQISWIGSETVNNALYGGGLRVQVDYPYSQSLAFVNSQNSYIYSPASSDWNLGSTWTIEFWIKANHSADGGIYQYGGIWGLVNQGGWSSTNSINIALSISKLCIGQGPLNSDVRYTEPTVGVWTHVAIVNNAGTQKVFYNGVEQTPVGTEGQGASTASYTNTTDTLNIGYLGSGGGGSFDGKMALVRISNTAKYTGTRTYTTTIYGDPGTIAYGAIGIGQDASDNYYLQIKNASSAIVLSIRSALTTGMKVVIDWDGRPGNTVAIIAGAIDNSQDYPSFPLTVISTTEPPGTSTSYNIEGITIPAPFAATTSYGVEADTKLFLSKLAPVVDLSYYELNGVVITAENTTNMYISKSTYPDLINRLQVGMTVSSLSTPNTGTVRGVVVSADSENWGVPVTTVPYRPGPYNFSGTRSVAVTYTNVNTSTDFPVSIVITNVSGGGGQAPAPAIVDFIGNVSQSTTGNIYFAWGNGTEGPHSVTVNPGFNTYTSPNFLRSTGADLITQITIASGPNACTSNIFTSAWDVPCLVEGTMITLADGSHKAIEDVRYDDLIRVWNFDLGEFSEALPVFVKREDTYTKHYRFTFSDGTVLRTVGHHVFNKQAGEFTMLIRDTTPVGTITFNEFGEEITLISKETIEESVKYYNVWTQYHLNLFADGILTGNRFNNIYPIQNMKFVKDNRALRSLEEFADIDPKYISGLRLQEQPAHYSAEYIKDYVENKLERLNYNQCQVLQN
jgi:hypothetical protein